MTGLTRIVETIARRRGFEVAVREDKLLLRHRDSPFTIIVSPMGENNVTITLQAEGLRDFVEDIRESEEAPREHLEELIDEISTVVNDVRTQLEREGYRVRLVNVRDLLMDALEYLEELEEE